MKIFSAASPPPPLCPRLSCLSSRFCSSFSSSLSPSFSSSLSPSFSSLLAALLVALLSARRSTPPRAGRGYRKTETETYLRVELPLQPTESPLHASPFPLARSLDYPYRRVPLTPPGAWLTFTPSPAAVWIRRARYTRAGPPPPAWNHLLSIPAPFPVIPVKSITRRCSGSGGVCR